MNRFKKTCTVLKNTNYLTVLVITPYNIIIIEVLNKIINTFKVLVLSTCAVIQRSVRLNDG